MLISGDHIIKLAQMSEHKVATIMSSSDGQYHAYHTLGTAPLLKENSIISCCS